VRHPTNTAPRIPLSIDVSAAGHADALLTPISAVLRVSSMFTVSRNEGRLVYWNCEVTEFQAFMTAGLFTCSR